MVCVQSHHARPSRHHGAELTGNLYERPAFPVAWARMEGKGRVFYTTMGHAAAIWKDPVFLRMLLGGIRWTSGLVDADVRVDIDKITPLAMEIPQHASKYIATDPPGPNPQFPNFSVHFPKLPSPPGRTLPVSVRKRVLVFTKSAGYEHPVVYREGASACFLEVEMLKFGQENDIDFVFSKDGTIFTPENIAQYDALLFYTSGDLTDPARNGPGDNYKMMLPESKQVFLQAIRDGKGFIGIHSAMNTFSGGPDPYATMLGAGYLGSAGEEKRRVNVIDKTFPGMERVPPDFQSQEEWYSFQNLQPGLHVILALDANHPVAWARMEGKGRVYYTSLGHGQEIWKDPSFRQMILGAIRWTTGAAIASVK